MGSRRQCETLITSGRVKIDGKVITSLGVKVDPDKSEISVDGETISSSVEKFYLLLNKPRGYTCTRRDPHAKHTVMELIGESYAHLYPVGRLDVDTSGLLILTNDGDFALMLTHPSHQIEKTYVAEVRGKITASTIEQR